MAGRRGAARVRWVALLRGINVGRAKRVAMADLRVVIEELGFGEVRTLLNSGNVVFTAPGSGRGNPAARIEKAVAEKLGVSSRVTALTAEDLGTIVSENPLGGVADNPSRLMVTIAMDAADLAQLQPVVRKAWAPEVLAVGSRAAYLWVPDGIADSLAFAAVAKILGDGATTRNWATILKLHALVAEPVSR
ncbi:MAG: DUF1697 domain-containing protein [Gemmatimonadales bacterium]